MRESENASRDEGKSCKSFCLSLAIVSQPKHHFCHILRLLKPAPIHGGTRLHLSPMGSARPRGRRAGEMETGCGFLRKRQLAADSLPSLLDSELREIWSSHSHLGTTERSLCRRPGRGRTRKHEARENMQIRARDRTRSRGHPVKPIPARTPQKPRKQ